MPAFRRVISILGLLCAGLPGTGALAQALWQTPTDGDVWDLAATDDLDGDGKADLIAGAADNTVRGVSGATGAVLWSVPAGGDVWRVISFPDLDGDGKKEAVAATGGNEVLVISASGALLWSHAVGGDVWSLAQAGDTNGDGVPELACGAGDNQAYLIDLKAKRRLWAHPLGGDVWSVSGGKDLTGDGVPDVVAGTAQNDIVRIDGKRNDAVVLIDVLGDAWQVLITEDVDGDVVPDIVAGTASNNILCVKGKPSAGPGPGGQKIIWEAPSASDVRVVILGPDYTLDGIPEVIAGGDDDVVRLLDGKTGAEKWSFTAGGAIKDAIVAPDMDKDGVLDVVFCTEASTVQAVKGSTGAVLWTYFTPLPAAFWSLAPLPDLDGDGLSECAAGSALNMVFALPAALKMPPESVSDLACFAAQTPSGPGVMLTWVETPETTAARVFEDVAGALTLLGEVPGGVQRFLTPLAGAADPRDFQVFAVGQGGESPPESCTATMAPPPVGIVECGSNAEGVLVTWILPDPGLRQLDNIRVVLDGVQVALLPPTATSHPLGKPADGPHNVVVTTVWGPWDSPTFTCLFETGASTPKPYIRGDANASGTVDISDGVAALNYLFLGFAIPCLAALDTNKDSRVDISDPVYLLNFLFLGGAGPPAPYPACGTVEGALNCSAFKPCQAP